MCFSRGQPELIKSQSARHLAGLVRIEIGQKSPVSFRYESTFPKLIPCWRLQYFLPKTDYAGKSRPFCGVKGKAYIRSIHRNNIIGLPSTAAVSLNTLELSAVKRQDS